jgi:hypothetical protein
LASTRNVAIVIGATCGMLAGVLVLLGATLAVMARQRNHQAGKGNDADDEMAEKGAVHCIIGVQDEVRVRIEFRLGSGLKHFNPNPGVIKPMHAAVILSRSTVYPLHAAELASSLTVKK